MVDKHLIWRVQGATVTKSPLGGLMVLIAAEDRDDLVDLAENHVRKQEEYRYRYLPSRYKMTAFEAVAIRKMRVDGGRTWRGVSEEFSGGRDDFDWNPGNQLEGMCLCEVAAEMCGESAYDSTWN